MDETRTRFAPSPTGALHVGNVRIAVFNWLFSRHTGGAFVVRMEDTDVERNVEHAEDGILTDLAWLGLNWDEGPGREGGYGPYRQSERGALYHEAARRGLDEGWAYPCFCSDEELAADQVTLESGATIQRYPARCRHRSPAELEARRDAGQEPLIRFRVPDAESIVIQDEIRGSISFPVSDFDDFVILRKDGRPTYNFAVVVDDVGMAISHVIRGAGHLSNTPKQVLLYQAMGRPAPRFVHLPTVLGPDRKKLSKRSGAAAVADLRREGYHPDAVVNYLSLLGWSDPQGREFLTREELVESVSLDRLGASDTVFDPEKMRWLSQQHFGALPPDEFAARALPFVDRARFPRDEHQLLAALEALHSRVAVLGEVDDFLPLVFPDDPEALEAVRREVASDAEARSVIQHLFTRLTEITGEWEAGILGQEVREVGKDLGVRGPALFHPIRRALTGVESGPDLGRVMVAHGRPGTLEALARTLRGPEV